jgi:hypothetical protein
MTLRIQFAIGVALAAIIVPVIIVQAQSEGETEAPRAGEVVQDVAEPATPTTADAAQQDTEAPPAEEEGVVLGEETVAEGESEPAPEGSDTEAATETPVEFSSASTTGPDLLTLGAASSTASSTEPVEDPPAVPYEEAFVLQPAVTLHQSGNSITADIELENLTCKACEKVLRAAQVKAYYTAWYPNDGEIKEVGERVAEKAIEVSDVALWSARSMTWSAADIAPGRYYFVVVVDPENAIGAYRMQRMEFAI